MVPLTIVLLSEHAPNTFNDLIEGGAEVASFSVTHYRLRTVDVDDDFDFPGVLFVNEHYVRSCRAPLILCKRADLLFGAGHELFRYIAMSPRDLDLHVTLPERGPSQCVSTEIYSDAERSTTRCSVRSKAFAEASHENPSTT